MLKLNVDDLTVDSFTTHDHQLAGGTPQDHGARSTESGTGTEVRPCHD